mgnify:CR=1 FL=1
MLLWLLLPFKHSFNGSLECSYNSSFCYIFSSSLNLISFKTFCYHMRKLQFSLHSLLYSLTLSQGKHLLQLISILCHIFKSNWNYIGFFNLHMLQDPTYLLLIISLLIRLTFCIPPLLFDQLFCILMLSNLLLFWKILGNL